MTDRRRINAGYVIVCAVPVGNTEFVLGVHQTVPEQFVTWECKDGTDYIWGHYTDSMLKATKDLCGRIMDEIGYLEQREKNIAERNQPGREKTEVWKAEGKQKREIER